MSRPSTLLLLGLFVSSITLAAGIAIEAQDSAAPVRRPAPAASSTGSFLLPAGKAEEAAARQGAPLELTSSDGTGLRLVALDARAVLEPPLAFTELLLTFENPEDRVLEGRFRIALPPGAAISRFAMKIGGAWQEGEVVERQRARRAYEDFLHLRQDPALLEQEAGNQFAARVFPIPARGRKEIAISYSHALPRAGQAFVIPLLGLPEIGQLDIRALLGARPSAGAASNLGGTSSERRMVELRRHDWRPDRDFEVAQEMAGERSGLRHGNLVVARVAPPVAETAQKIRGLYVLVDSSASRALGFERQARLAGDLLEGLREGSRGEAQVGLAAFDQEVAPIFEGRSSGLDAAALARLRERRALGASNLEGALGWLAERLAKSGGRYPRVLILTDGIATAGDTDPAALKAAVRALRERGVERLDVLAAGGLRDDALLRELVSGNLAHDGATIDAEAPLEEIARRLTLACRSGIAVTVPGASWVWPEKLDGVQPGDVALVYADLPAGRPLEIRLDGRRVDLGTIAEAERPLLERQWVAARIDRLLHLSAAGNAGDQDVRRALALQVTELSIRHRVMSPLTAFLVLETEADYVRYGLDRRALADILTVGLSGLEVLARSAPPPAPAAPPPPPAPKPSQVPGRDGAFADAERDSFAEPVTQELATPAPAVQPVEVPEAAESLPEEMVDEAALRVSGGVEGEVEGGVEGGVVGGVSGGMAGSVPGGSPGGVIGVVPHGAAIVPTAGENRGAQEAARERVQAREAEPAAAKKPPAAPPYTGRFAEVMAALAARDAGLARATAFAWHAAEPGDVLALVALGEVFEAAADKAEAARAYGSLIDLYPGRADLRRYAGERLERLGQEGLGLAADTYAKAVADRPDHASGHRLLAWSLAAAGRFEEAFAALEHGLAQKYPEGRFAEAGRVMREDLGLVAAAWLREQPTRRETVLARLRQQGAALAVEPSLRFVLSWETDANDVDLHVFDRDGGHAYYSKRNLASGGSLYADVTNGYGPECFAIPLPAKGGKAAPYRLAADYYRRGPMGFGMGLLQVIEHDGNGGLEIEPRPFVVMVERTMVDLGTVD